jgi:hypothetical protein
MNLNSPLKLSQHAETRINQRGITKDTLSFIMDHADTWLHSGEGCMSARISKKKCKILCKKQTSASVVDRANNVVVVISSSNAKIVTALHDKGAKNSRHYRKQFPTRSKKRRLKRYDRWDKKDSLQTEWETTLVIKK